MERPSPSQRVLLLISFAALAALVVFSACARRAETKTREQAKPPLEFLGEWGITGQGPEQLYQPFGLAADSAGSVYLTDNGNGFIHKFNVLGHPLLSFQDPLAGSPGPIAVDSGGAIYVADTAKKRIYLFLPNGDRLREQRRGGGAHFRSVGGLAVDGEGNLYVSDTDANQVVKFDPRGRLKKAWGKRGSSRGEFHAPFSLAVGPDGFVYVVDSGNSRIQKFTREGAFAAVWGGSSLPSGLAVPLALAVSDKFVFVTDGDTLVQMMTLDGAILHTENLSAHVKFNSHFPGHAGIALAGMNELLVLDSAGAKVLLFRINL